MIQYLNKKNYVYLKMNKIVDISFLTQVIKIN